MKDTNVSIETDQYDFNLYDYINKDMIFKSTEDRKIQAQQLEKLGFFMEQSRNGDLTYRFYENVFAKYLLKAITCVQDTNGNLYIYNINGFYEERQEWKIQKIIKYLMCQIKDLWKLQYEMAGLEAYKRDLYKVVNNFNMLDIINLENGVLDTNTLTLSPHSHEYYSTIKLPIEYNASATCQRFRQFIREITNNDVELASVIQEMVGYCLCHNTKAEKAFFLYGNGKNGKSVLVKVIERLVGKGNISNVPLQQLGESFGIASMVNKNVNISAENELKGKINTQYFKAIVSGDSVNINRKYKDDLQCKLTTKMVMLVNNLPDTSDVTYGYFRRLLILPFNRRFDGVEQDVNLFEKLEKELPGILNWALEGLKRLEANNYQFSDCKVIDHVMKTYENKQNPTQEFFEDMYVRKEGGRINKSEIYQAYNVWANQNGLEVVSRQTFWNLLKAKSSEKNSSIDLSDERKIKGCRYICGYAPKESDVNEDEDSEL